jgi:type VI secretion system secreted protein VgrG
VLCDSPAAHTASDGFAKLPLRTSDAAERRDRQSITAWQLKRQLTSGAVALTDYDFERPRVNIGQRHADAPGNAHGAYEVFEYPGQYTQEGAGDDYARKRLQALQGPQQSASATTSSTGLACGATFTLQGHPSSQHNIAYLITSTHIEIRCADYEALTWQHGQDTTERDSKSATTATTTTTNPSTDEHGDHMSCRLVCIDALTPYRNAYNNNTNGKTDPNNPTNKPKIPGPQTAVVTGPAGEEIYTDNHGRIKVKFHWDRHGKADETSSCWIRVSQSWAGKSFGFMAIPRIGQEVIVDFLNGDPDCPLITGRVYNAEQTPPWDLPANKTQTGILTRSFEQGAYANANALRFEDKRGQEQLWLHAEKDQLTEVENDEDKWVGNDRRKTIDRDETSLIKRDRTETVDHDETITVHNNRKERVDHNETISIGDNRAEDVGKNETIDIGNNRTETVGDNETVTIGKHRRMTIGQSETLTVATSKTDSIGSNHRISIGSNQTIRIGKMKTETIGMASMQNVGLGRMDNVGLGYSLNVGMIMSTVVGLNQIENVGQSKSIDVGDTFDITVAEELRITVGESSLVMKADGTILLNGKTIDMVGSKHVGVESERIDLN